MHGMRREGLVALRGKKPKERSQRLRLLLTGPAGCGKTTAAIQMPKPYLIDTEQGATHYGDLIERSGGVVYETTDVMEVIKELHALMGEKHPYLTVVIDPITTLYNEAVDVAEKRVGTEFGKHVVAANKLFKRVCALLTNPTLDMNVIVTAHEKNEYGGKMEVIAKTFDGYKKLDYIFDLWLRLERNPKDGRRYAEVRKTRLAEFPDGETFLWSYAELVKRFGIERLESGVKQIAMSTEAEVEEFSRLLMMFSDDELKSMGMTKMLKEYADIGDIPRKRMQMAIPWLKEKIKTATGPDPFQPEKEPAPKEEKSAPEEVKTEEKLTPSQHKAKAMAHAHAIAKEFYPEGTRAHDYVKFVANEVMGKEISLTQITIAKWEDVIDTLKDASVSEALRHDFETQKKGAQNA